MPTLLGIQTFAAYLIITGSVSSLLVVPFAKPISEFLGHMNVMYLQVTYA
jgi:hypothetical protein